MAPLLNSEQLELKDSIRSFLAEFIPLASVRKIFEGDETLRSTVWSKVVELGVLQFFSESASSGGGTLRELGMLANEAGYALLPVNLVESAFLAHLLHAQASLQDQERISACFGSDFLSELSEGNIRVGIVLGGRSGTKLEKTRATDGTTRIDFKARFVSVSDKTEAVLISVAEDNQVWLCDLRGASRDSFKLCPESCLDRTLEMHAIEVSQLQAVQLESMSAKMLELNWSAIKSCEISGAARRTLDSTVEYVKARQQFDLPIGGFQAVQHAAADMLVKVEAMHSLSDFACWAAHYSPDQAELAARSAAVFCSDEGPKVTEKAIQIHGGIGFTWEHDLHLFLRRCRTIAALIKPDENGRKALIDAALGS